MKGTKTATRVIRVQGEGIPVRVLKAVELMYLGKSKLFGIQFDRIGSLLYRSRLEYQKDGDSWSKGNMRYYAKVLRFMDCHYHDYERLIVHGLPFRVERKYAR